MPASHWSSSTREGGPGSGSRKQRTTVHTDHRCGSRFTRLGVGVPRSRPRGRTSRWVVGRSVGRVLDPGPDTSTGKRFGSVSRYEVAVCVRDRLSTDSGYVPANVPSIWSMVFGDVIPHLLQQSTRRRPLLLGEVEHRVSMDTRQHHRRALRGLFGPHRVAVVVGEHDTGLCRRQAEGALRHPNILPPSRPVARPICQTSYARRSHTDASISLPGTYGRARRCLVCYPVGGAWLAFQQVLVSALPHWAYVVNQLSR